MGDWPLFGMGDDVRPALAEALAHGQASALVTQIAVQGGAPRPPGAQMLVTPTTLSGFLSGGCVEADVASHGLAVIADGQPRRLVYGQGSPWPDIRLLCGARIELLVERLLPTDPAARRLVQLRADRIPALWRTNGQDRRCEPSDARSLAPRLQLDPAPFSIELYCPPQKRLVVVGADPTALAITRLALDMGYKTHLIRPKGPASPPPGIVPHAYHHDEVEPALLRIGLDPWTFVAVATHDTEIDEQALKIALPSPAPYVGVLGARRRLSERLERLGALGLTDEQLDRLKAPIGLDLGGKAPFEIAVAVMAQITAQVSA
jgi:xanthine dehydrogenase accessory factor